MDICLHFDQENGLFDALLSGRWPTCRATMA